MVSREKIRTTINIVFLMTLKLAPSLPRLLSMTVLDYATVERIYKIVIQRTAKAVRRIQKKTVSNGDERGLTV